MTPSLPAPADAGLQSLIEKAKENLAQLPSIKNKGWQAAAIMV